MDPGNRISSKKNILSAGLLIVVFFALSVIIFGLQQKMVEVVRETNDMMVPKLLSQIRAVRNLELLRQYGALATKAVDPATRREAAFLAEHSATSLSYQVDELTRKVSTEVYDYIETMATGGPSPALWSDIDQKLTARANDLTVAISSAVLERVDHIHGDTVIVRNIALTQATLFFASTAVMILFGRVLLTRIRERNRYFNELSHDFRQRVHHMEISLETASQADAGGLHAEVVRVRSLMGDLQRYLDNFLDIARMETVVVTPVFATFELFSLFQRLALQFEDMAEQRKVDLRFRFNAFLLCSDEKLLQRALENLIANALKFSRGKVLVAARRKGALVQIFVIDNGRGMPHQINRRPQKSAATAGSVVFEYFAQGANSASVPDHGFGLGLAIVKRAIDILGADLNIRSMAERGTAVCIEFPAQS